MVAVGVAAALAVVATVGLAVARAPDPSKFGAVVARAERVTGARPVALADVTPALVRAVVDTEDERFWRHHGVDVEGVLRAAGYDATHLSTAQGASTITEQLCKRLYLGGDDHSPWRKLEDAVTAFRLESRTTKDQILAAYLNTVYFGDGAYGVERASERYFGLSPSRLSLAQATMLAGLVQAPAAYDPLTDPSAARQRQSAVLLSMVRAHDLTATRADAALDSPLRLADGSIIPALAGANVSVGPAFASGELGLGLVALVAGLTLVLATRRRRTGGRIRSMRPALLGRAAGAATIVLGLAAAIRSFRVG